jgi:hypothetical protein
MEDFIPEELAFEYCYETAGFEGEYEWRSDEEFEGPIPRGIKVILTLKNKTRKREEVFAKTVFIPMGRFGSDIE